MTNICFMRNKKGWTQAHVAKLANISTQSYVRYEQFGFPYADRILTFAGIFGCSTDYLLENPNQSEQPPSADLTVEEQAILNKFRQLSGKNKVAQAKHMDYLLFTQESEAKTKIS